MSTEIDIKQVRFSRGFILWTLVALLVLVVGRIDPAVYLQSGLLVIGYIPLGIVALIGTPASVFLVVAGFFYFGFHKSKGGKRVVAVSALFIAVALSALTFYQAISTSGKGISQHLALFIVAFSSQVIYGTWQREPILSRPVFKIAVATSFGVLFVSSILLFMVIGKDATYRDPIPMGLLAGSGLFLILMELLRVKIFARIVIASLCSHGLVILLFFTFGFALSMGFSWNPDYSLRTLTSGATLNNLLIASISLSLFQITYAVLKRQKKKLVY